MDKPVELSVDELRQQIDTIDEKVLQCLNQRAELVLQLGRIKRRTGQAILDPNREKALFDRLRELNQGPLPTESVANIFEQIVVHSRNLQESIEQA